MLGRNSKRTMSKEMREDLLQECKDYLRDGDFIAAKMLYMEIVDDGPLTTEEIGEIDICVPE